MLGSKTEPLAYFNATGKANWRGRPARRSVPPTLRRVVAAVTEQQLEDVQLVPVSVFWGQSPDRETSPWKLLWADNWVVTGRLRKLARILVLGRLTRVQFSKPLSLGELASQRPDPQRLERLVMRQLRIHFRNVRQAVIGPDLSHRRTLLRGLLRAPPGTGDHRPRDCPAQGYPRAHRRRGGALCARDRLGLLLSGGALPGRRPALVLEQHL